MQIKVLLVLLVFSLVGCAQTEPYRSRSEPPPGQACQGEYDRSDHYANATTVDFSSQYPGHDATGLSCWQSAWEPHTKYDLFFTEFDDQGWENRAGPHDEGQIASLMHHLTTLMSGPDGPKSQPLNIVIFVHGWHHTAQADDSNVKEFRFLLEKTAELEDNLASLRNPSSSADASASASSASPQFLWQKPRRVVGVYVGWRGNSIMGEGIENLSILDRKFAAETVSAGDVHILFANLHNFYLRNSCHREVDVAGETEKGASGAAKQDCADVRMLVLGHSFGALIAYRSLASRLVSNIVESYQDSPGSDRHDFAYSYGDLVILINPAFEATRFEALAQAGASRNYPGPSSAGRERGAQLPVLIVAQSMGDDATGTFFPLFRSATTLFDDARGTPEKVANIKTVGWDDRYVTHHLSYEKGKGYDCRPSEDNLACEQRWWREQRALGYAGLDASVLPLPENLVLAKKVSPEAQIVRTPYDPVWVVQSTKEVIADHDDVLNLNFIRFVRQMYSTVLREEDCTLLRHADVGEMASLCPTPAIKAPS